jgi:hypothetical protein
MTRHLALHGRMSGLTVLGASDKLGWLDCFMGKCETPSLAGISLESSPKLFMANWGLRSALYRGSGMFATLHGWERGANRDLALETSSSIRRN